MRYVGIFTHGIELEDEDAAREAATTAVRQLLAEGFKSGIDRLHYAFEVYGKLGTCARFDSITERPGQSGSSSRELGYREQSG